MPSGAFTGNFPFIPFIPCRLKDVKLNALQNDYLGLSKLWVLYPKNPKFQFSKIDVKKSKTL